MISISGSLRVSTISGRYGPFNVGKLKTDIGEFAVKEKFLEEFDEGSYDGRFVITRIAGSTYPAGTRIVMEIRAHVSDYTLDDVGGLTEEDRDTIQPQDPIESEHGESEQAPAESTESDSSADRTVSLDKLFGEVDYTADRVKLDSTVDRKVLREQAHYLRERGYQYLPKEQVWERKR